MAGEKVSGTIPSYLTPKQDDYNQIPELQVGIAEALYDVDSIVADPGAYTKEQLATVFIEIIPTSRKTAEKITMTTGFHSRENYYDHRLSILFLK